MVVVLVLWPFHCWAKQGSSSAYFPHHFLQLASELFKRKKLTEMTGWTG
jgi:hypothetical protein